MKLVGDVMAGVSLDNPPPVIGVASWGVVAGREHLCCTNPRDHSDNLEMDYGLFLNDSLPTSSSVVRRPGHSKNVPLDPNHSFFVLVDDGKEGSFGGEISFRAGFEAAVGDMRGVLLIKCFLSFF